MTVDREELRRLCTERCWSSSALEVRNNRLVSSVPALLDDLDTKDRRIAELEAGLREAIGVIDNSSGVDESLVQRLRHLLPSEET